MKPTYEKICGDVYRKTDAQGKITYLDEAYYLTEVAFDDFRARGVPEDVLAKIEELLDLHRMDAINDYIMHSSS